MERMRGLLAVQGVALPLKEEEMAFDEDQVAPDAAGPRQMRQVAMSTFAVKAGSSSEGGSRRLASELTCVAPMVAGGTKFAAVHAEPSVQAERLMPAPMERNQ